MIKTCPICNKDFEVKRKNQKYCSSVCRDKGAHDARKAWERKTGYIDRKRERRQQDAEEKRLRELEQINERQRKRAQEVAEWIEAEDKAREEELKKRAAAGDYEALMETATDDVTYYKYFALAEIEREERDFGRRSTREINGISVYEPDFAERVVKSIAETGHCFSRSYGLGANIDT